MRNYFLLIVLFCGPLLCTAQQQQQSAILYQSPAYSVYSNSIIQGRYKAVAISPTEITSNYQSADNSYKNPVINFNFSINSKRDEMPSGKSHRFVCLAENGINETPVIKFGVQYTDHRPVPKSFYLKPGTRLKLRVDMRSMLSAFKKQGYYVCYNGDKIYKEDFKGVYVAGEPSPLIWDYNNLSNHDGLELKDPDGDGIYETTLTLGSNTTDKTASSWKLSRDISVFPQYHSPYILSDALYNLSLEEMQHAVEPDSTFRTGKEWGGVWTRDISYSIILSMAALQPKVAMYSLMRKVKNGRVIQDTGTGGSYPCAVDRMIWAVAAWEVYKVTGDKEWLKKTHTIIKQSVADDEKNIYDPATGMVHGESSFLDWEEETYPQWMQAADIYQSECLGTNAVHYQVNKVLAAMCRLLNDPDANKYEQQAAGIKKGMYEHLWMSSKGYFGQYLYGRNYQMLSPKSEALGEALAVFFDAATPDMEKSVVENTPVNAFGIPCIYPQIPGIFPYHNNAIWPFVESYWALAAAKTGNEASLIRAISAIYRPTAMFLTNKENFLATSGDYAGTQINSSNMLWSLSGNLALVYKVFFGIHYQVNSLEFKPFVPRPFAGKRVLDNYHYRNAILSITMNGYGNQIKSITLDDKPLVNAEVPDNLYGKHEVHIVLADNATDQKSNLVKYDTSLRTPVVVVKNSKLSWEKVPGASSYSIIKNGKVIASTNRLNFAINVAHYGEYQIKALSANGIESFNSEPVNVTPPHSIVVVQAEIAAPKSDLPYRGFEGEGFVEISKTLNLNLDIPVYIAHDGLYAIDYRYSNGNGPTNTGSKCAVRSLNVDSSFAGTIVFPQRGTGQWSDWGYTNPVIIKLSKGVRHIKLSFERANENMNGETNEAMIDYVRIIKM